MGFKIIFVKKKFQIVIISFYSQEQLFDFLFLLKNIIKYQSTIMGFKIICEIKKISQKTIVTLFN